MSTLTFSIPKIQINWLQFTAVKKVIVQDDDTAGKYVFRYEEQELPSQDGKGGTVKGYILHVGYAPEGQDLSLPTNPDEVTVNNWAVGVYTIEEFKDMLVKNIKNYTGLVAEII